MLKKFFHWRVAFRICFGENPEMNQFPFDQDKSKVSMPTKQGHRQQNKPDRSSNPEEAAKIGSIYGCPVICTVRQGIQKDAIADERRSHHSRPNCPGFRTRPQRIRFLQRA